MEAFRSVELNDSIITETKEKILVSYSPDLVATDVVIGILAFFFVTLVVLKIMMGSQESLLSINKYDLILFKTPNNYQKNSTVAGRRLFDNSKVMEHNLKALLESGFDDKLLHRETHSNNRRKITTRIT